MFNKFHLSLIQRICLAGLFIALAALLNKIIAINYLPFAPFLRISLGGSAVVIFSSILLGPLFGTFTGIFMDVLGYLLFDPKNLAFFPQITAIYAVLGFVSYFIYFLFIKIKNDKIMFVIESSVMVSLCIFISLFIIMNNTLTLYDSTYDILLWQKITLPIILGVLTIALIVSLILLNRYYTKKNNPQKVYQLSFSLFITEILVFVIFGTFMKALAFGSQTILMIFITQIIVMFINVPLNSWLITLFLNIVKKIYKNN